MPSSVIDKSKVMNLGAEGTSASGRLRLVFLLQMSPKTPVVGHWSVHRHSILRLRRQEEVRRTQRVGRRVRQ